GGWGGTRIWLVTRAASAPSAAPSGESVTVDRNSAIAPTPSIETATYRTAPMMRAVTSFADRETPETDVTAEAFAGKSVTPMAYEVTATATTATNTKSTIDVNLATSNRLRLTGRSKR